MPAAAAVSPVLGSLSLATSQSASGAGALLPASGASASLPQFRELDWRLEVQVARRHLHDAMEPQFQLRLGVFGLGPEGAGDAAAAAAAGSGAAAAPPLPLPLQQQLAAPGPHSFSFTSDYATLKRASVACEEAAAELRTAHAKRVQRYIH